MSPIILYLSHDWENWERFTLQMLCSCEVCYTYCFSHLFFSSSHGSCHHASHPHRKINSTKLNETEKELDFNLLTDCFDYIFGLISICNSDGDNARILHSHEATQPSSFHSKYPHTQKRSRFTHGLPIDEKRAEYRHIYTWFIAKIMQRLSFILIKWYLMAMISESRNKSSFIKLFKYNINMQTDRTYKKKSVVNADKSISL